MPHHQDEPIADMPSLVAAVAAGLRPQYIFFWNVSPGRRAQLDKECLSQWWPCAFEVEGVTYPSAEHFMMAEKARLFGDAEARAAILSNPSPEAAKKLGRGVRGFDSAHWNQHCFEIVTRGNLAKFSQNPPLHCFLIDTCPKILVEASPYDQIWGIGLAEDDPRALEPRLWPGKNLLGFALMAVRARLAARA